MSPDGDHASRCVLGSSAVAVPPVHRHPAVMAKADGTATGDDFPALHPGAVTYSRNELIGFAQRTRKNLAYIENAYGCGEDVHVVTQLMVSLLGLVVFPWEEHKPLFSDSLASLVAKGWPEWKILEGHSATLDQLIRRLRNAVAHQQVQFSSDSRSLAEVTIRFWNVPPKTPHFRWTAEIATTDLRTFCIRFIELVEERLW